MAPPAITTTQPASPVQQFPGALALRETFPFGSGDVASTGTVYRVWVNDTYHWYNIMDNNYYTQSPPSGYKYLIVFIDLVNNGNTRVWPPGPADIHLWYNGTEYFQDPDHYLPDPSVENEAPPVTIQEIEYLHNLENSELVEDYGYSHGNKLDYLYPGVSNALDGYLIYVVPAALTPDKTFVQIAFNGKDVGVWNLA
jgi:hypothetical protein